MTIKFALPFAALAVVGALAACDKVAPATPETTPGPVAQENALNGSYNLVASRCGDPTSDKSLTIDGNRFIFPGSTCTVASSEQQVNRTQVTLSCAGGPAAGNRIVQLQQRPGVLRVTEGPNTLTYFQCQKEIASSNTQIGL